MTVEIAPATAADADDLWAILGPVIEAGETYALPRDFGCERALAYWLSPSNRVFVARSQGRAVGTYILRPNQLGGGDHVANAGYMVAPRARGLGVARAMCRHSQQVARGSGFRAMQFNFVVATNAAAIRLWASEGFETLARLPLAFRHPTQGLVDALVMHKALDEPTARPPAA